MGWNRLLQKQPSPLLDNIAPDAMFYFVHSYFACPADDSIVLAETDYGVNFVSAVGKGNIFGVQFHPEKSGEPGLQILKNFASVCAVKKS
jgi:glutamine amidotransferase